LLTTRSLKSQLYRALDDRHINQKDFDGLYADVELEIKKYCFYNLPKSFKSQGIEI